MFGVIVEFCLAEPNGGTTNHHGKRASRSEVFCRRHFGASDSGKARSEHVWRPCTDPRANGGRVDRYYDPVTDQFLSVDPLVAETGQPYAFVGDDPVNETDPRGDGAHGPPGTQSAGCNAPTIQGCEGLSGSTPGGIYGGLPGAAGALSGPGSSPVGALQSYAQGAGLALAAPAQSSSGSWEPGWMRDFIDMPQDLSLIHI